MDAIEIVVVAAAVLTIGIVLWYFFGEREQVIARVSQGVQEIKITVKGGYSPDVIVVREGVPVKLDFFRDETDSCSDRVIFGDFGIARALPAYKTTSIEFTPKKTGEFVFTCGMNMLRGKILVKPA